MFILTLNTLGGNHPRRYQSRKHYAENRLIIQTKGLQANKSVQAVQAENF
jgi:hypothetical protein